MKTNRRGFLGGVIGGALASMTRAKKVSPSLEIILNDPNLFHFKASVGNTGQIWLNNVLQEEHVTEWVCSPRKGKSVLGAIRKVITNSSGIAVIDSGGFVQEWIIGVVRWEPLGRTVELIDYESDLLLTSMAR